MEHWIGVALDGTLAHFDRFRGTTHIGRPVPAMVKKVRKLLESGKKIKIVTPRVAQEHPDTVLEIQKAVQAWTAKHVGVPLEVTCSIDMAMTVLYDSRAIQVISNTGRIVTPVNKMKDK